MIKISTPFKFLIIVFVSAFFFIVQQALSYASGPPSGNTGAPGESDCTSCHNTSTAVSNSSKISVYTNMTGGVYIPDSTYAITVRARSSGCVKFGFQTTILNSNSTPTKLGVLGVSTTATDVQLLTGTRDYVEHTSSGNSPIYTDSTDWTFNWTAPSTPSGDAKMYVALNVTDNSGTSSGDEINLKTITLPQTSNVPVASITTNTNAICQNDSIQFSGSGTNGGNAYQWTFPNGTPATSTAQSVWVKFSSSGSKVCSLRVANSIMYSNYTTKTVTINGVPSASISYNSSVTLCDGDSINLTGSAGSGNTYQWSRDGNNISGATNQVYLAKQSGIYRVTVTNSGCSNTSAPATLTFNTKPSATLTAPAGISSCQGDSLRLKANGGTGYSFYWYKDNVLQTTTLDSNYYAKGSGSYFVRIFTNQGCNTQSNAIGLSFYVKPSGLITANSDSVCQGDSLLLSSITSDTIASYEWRRNNFPISGATAKNYFASIAGSYTVTFTTNRGCVSTSPPKIITVNPIPNPNFIDSTKAQCTYVLKIRNTGNFTYRWQFNGNTFNTIDTMVTVTQTGFYNAIITNASGCSISTNTLFITVANAPNVTITPLNNAVICSDSSGVTYQVPPASGQTYKWYKNGTLINGAIANSLNITDSGNYYVVVDNGSCAVQSSTRNVKVVALPPANFIDSVKVGCAYRLNLRNVGPYDVAWSRNGTVFNVNDTAITATQSGTYSLKLTNSGGCSITTNSIVLTIPTKLPDIGITPTVNAVICSDSNTTYQVPAVSGSSYQWYKNGVLIGGATQNALTISDSGNYTVAVNNGFCTLTSVARNVKVNLSPDAVAVGVNLSFCTGDSATVSVVNTAGAFYQWSKDGSLISNATSNVYVAKASGSYVVTVTLGNCFRVSNALTVTEKTLPAVPVITRNVDVLTSTAASSYQWYKNGTAISGATSQSHTVTSTGTYTVEVTGSNGCKNISAGMLVIPTGINAGSTGGEVKAYPNPVYNDLNLTFAAYDHYAITIVDASGRTLDAREVSGTKATIDFSPMESGIYFVKITSDNHSQILRIVKE